MSETSGLILQNVRIVLNRKAIVEIDARIGPGEVLSVMGPSGSGKSTLLAFIGGYLDRAFEASGEVLLNGVNILEQRPHERKIGLLFQDGLLFPHMSVGRNLMFALPENIRPKAERRRRVSEALESIGLEGFETRDPATLSGGQQARAALVRALLSDPSALLLDEPFSKLDAGLRDQIRTLVFDEVRKRRLPALLVTHDADDARAAGGLVISL